MAHNNHLNATAGQRNQNYDPTVRNDGKIKTLRILNLFAALLIFIVNILATALPLNNRNTGDISDQHFTFITPAGYAFSIWGVIYFFIAAFAIYQLLPRSYPSRTINEGIGYIFIINSLFNIGWIFAWHWEVWWLTLVMMAGILGTLLIIYIRLSVRFYPPTSWEESLLVFVPWSFYLGWIVAAAMVNIFAVFTNAVDEYYASWGVAALCIVFLVEAGLGAWRRDPVIIIVGAWAVFAITMNNQRIGSEKIRITSAFAAVSLLVEFVLISLSNIYHLIRHRERGVQVGGV